MARECKELLCGGDISNTVIRIPFGKNGKGAFPGHYCEKCHLVHKPDGNPLMREDWAFGYYNPQTKEIGYR